MNPKTRITLRENMRVTPTEAGAIVIDGTTFVASEVNSSGQLILSLCRGEGASFDAITHSFAAEAECSPEEAREAVETFLLAAQAENWLDIEDDEQRSTTKR